MLDELEQQTKVWLMLGDLLLSGGVPHNQLVVLLLEKSTNLALVVVEARGNLVKLGAKIVLYGLLLCSLVWLLGLEVAVHRLTLPRLLRSSASVPKIWVQVLLAAVLILLRLGSADEATLSSTAELLRIRLALVLMVLGLLLMGKVAVLFCIGAALTSGLGRRGLVRNLLRCGRVAPISLVDEGL